MLGVGGVEDNIDETTQQTDTQADTDTQSCGQRLVDRNVGICICRVGEDVKALTKGMVSAYAGPVEKIFSPAHVTLSFTNKDEVTESVIRDKASARGRRGRDTGCGVRQGDLRNGDSAGAEC